MGKSQNSFDGKRGSSIIEYLHNWNRAFELCPLSEAECIEVLIHSTTGDPNQRIRSWADLDHSLYQIYSLLLTTYDKGLSPDLAEQKLKNYKAIKTSDSCKVEADILHFAGIASSKFTNKSAKEDVFNSLAIKTYLDAMPDQSRRTFEFELQKFSNELNRSVKFTDL